MSRLAILALVTFLPACGGSKTEESLFDLEFSNDEVLTNGEIEGYWEAQSAVVDSTQCLYRLKIESNKLTASVRLVEASSSRTENFNISIDIQTEHFAPQETKLFSVAGQPDSQGRYGYCEMSFSSAELETYELDGFNLITDFGTFYKLGELRNE